MVPLVIPLVPIVQLERPLVANLADNLQRGQNSLSPTGSALAPTDLSPLTNGIWEIHAGCSCFLHLQLLAKIG